MMNSLNNPRPKIIRPPRPTLAPATTDAAMAAQDKLSQKEIALPKRREPLEVYYEDRSKNYLVLDAKGDYISINEASLKRRLKQRGLSVEKGPNGSEIDSELNRVQDQFRVAYAGPLAGYMKGLHIINGRNFLVTDSPKIIQPVPGKWPIIQKLLEGMFVHEDCDQLRYFFGWMKRRLEALHRHERLPGQALILAGPRGCGKSLTQSEIITPLVGGRSANPYKFMSSDTGFNGDCGAAEHLVIDDEAARSDHRARHNFGSQIKQVTVGAMQRVEAKFQNAFDAPLIQALTISLNDEPENLLVLPLIDDSLADKLILLKVGKAGMPMPTRTPEEMKAFREAIRAELPRFAYFLQNWVIPEELISPRFGVTHFHHFDLLESVEELEPWVQFLGLLDSFYKYETSPIEINSVDLSAKLLDSYQNNYAGAAQKLLYFNNACGTYLKRVADNRPERVTWRKTNQGKLWTIYPPKPSAKTV